MNLKSTVSIGIPFVMIASSFSMASDLLISGVYDGPLTGGTPKGVELYVVNDIPDLSNYGLGSANNGGGSDSEEFTLPTGSASAGSFIYVTSSADPFTAYFGFAPDYSRDRRIYYSKTPKCADFNSYYDHQWKNDLYIDEGCYLFTHSRADWCDYNSRIGFLCRREDIPVNP